MSPMSHEQAVAAGRKTAAIRWGYRGKSQVVGFYREHGKTKPITKPIAELQRKKVVQNARQFKSVNPHQSREDMAQRLENLSEKLTEAKTALETLNQQRTEETHEFALAKIDAARTEKQREIANLLVQIKRLHP